MRRIAVVTTGGDAPGMNAAIRAVTRSALWKGVSVLGCRRGYDGIIEGEMFEMSSTDVGGIVNLGGTILRTGRSERFLTQEGRARAASRLKQEGVEGLVVIGGDGSIRGGKALAEEHGLAVVGIPASIDNDIPCTDSSIGFDTAVNTAVEAIDKVRDTAYSHERIFAIEVMGRRNGFIAVEAGIAGGAEAVLIPEVPFCLEDVCKSLAAGQERGKKSSIIVVAEGALSAEKVREFVEANTGYELRVLVLGHMQRGGNPTAWDRVLATRLGAAAVIHLMNGSRSEMVGLQGNKIIPTPLETVCATQKTIDVERLMLAEVMAQ